MRSQSTVLVKSTGTPLSKVSGSKMTKVKATEPLSDPKSFIMTNTKKGQAKMFRKEMPATGRIESKLAMEEKSYKTVEYNLLHGRQKGSQDVNTPLPNNHLVFCHGPSS